MCSITLLVSLSLSACNEDLIYKESLLVILLRVLYTVHLVNILLLYSLWLMMMFENIENMSLKFKSVVAFF